MKITTLIDSKSVAEYLEKRNYEFSVLQCAYIIAKSKKLPLREKQTAWMRLTETMEDCAVINGSTREYHESLFGVLRKIIELQNTYIEKFFREDEAIFCLDCASKNGAELLVCGDSTHTLYESTHPAGIDDRQGVVFTVGKRLFNSRLSITATLSELDEVLDLRVYDVKHDTTEYLAFFDNTEVNFPVPFSVGDVLYELGNENAPLVLKGFSNCGQQAVYCMASYPDDSGTWFDNVLWLDYYRRPFSEYDAELQALSERLKLGERK